MKKTFKTLLIVCMITILGFGLSACDNANQKQAKDLDATITSFVNTTSSLDWADSTTISANKTNTQTQTDQNSNTNYQTSQTSSVTYDVTNINNSLETIQGKVSKIIGSRATLGNYINDLNNGAIQLSKEDENAINAYKNIIKENTSYLESNNGTIRNTVNSIVGTMNNNSSSNMINAYVIRSNEIISTRCAKIDAAYEAMKSIETILKNAKNTQNDVNDASKTAENTSNNKNQTQITTNTSSNSSNNQNNNLTSKNTPAILPSQNLNNSTNNASNNTTSNRTNLTTNSNQNNTQKHNTSVNNTNNQSSSTSETTTNQTNNNSISNPRIIRSTRTTYPTRRVTNNRNGNVTTRNTNNYNTYRNQNGNTSSFIRNNTNTNKTPITYNTSISNIKRPMPNMQTNARSSTSGLVVNTNESATPMPYYSTRPLSQNQNNTTRSNEDYSISTTDINPQNEGSTKDNSSTTIQNTAKNLVA